MALSDVEMSDDEERRIEDYQESGESFIEFHHDNRREAEEAKAEEAKAEEEIEISSATAAETPACRPPIEKIKMPETIYSMIGKGRGLTLVYGFFIWFIQVGLLVCLTSDSFIRPISGDYVLGAKLAQFFAVIAFFILAENCMTEVFGAIQFCPNPFNKEQFRNNKMLFLASVLRFLQGSLAIITNTYLILEYKSPASIVLAITTVETISRFDEQGFNIAKSGRYWLGLEKAAQMIADMDAPDYACKSSDTGKFRKRLFRFFEFLAFAIVIGSYILEIKRGTTIADLFNFNIFRESHRKSPRSLRVEFPQSSGLMDYSGCYVKLSTTNSHYNHFNISNTMDIETEARFGYCEDAGRYVFFTNTEDPCDVDAQIAQSEDKENDPVTNALKLIWYTPPNKPFESFHPRLAEDKDNVCNSFWQTADLAEGQL